MLNTGKFVYHEGAWRAAEQTAKALEIKLVNLRLEALGDLAGIASICAKEGCNALYVIPDPILANWRGHPLVLQLKNPWRDGTPHIRMSPLDFMQRLAAPAQACF